MKKKFKIKLDIESSDSEKKLMKIAFLGGLSRKKSLFPRFFLKLEWTINN